MAIYMKMGKIEGNVTAQGYEKLMECESVTLSTDREITLSVGAGKEREVSKPAFQEIMVTKEADKATPYLFQEAFTGKAVDEVEIRFAKTSNDAIETYMTYVLKDALISSYQISSGSDGDPYESVSIAFTKFEMKYHPRESDNQLGSAIPVGYDLKLGKKS